MKTFYAFILCVIVLIPSTSAQVCRPPEPIDQQAAVGIWQGHYTENGEIRNLKVELKELGGRLVSFIDMPAHGLKNSRFETTICPSMDLHLKRTSADNVTLQFIGKPKGNRMAGRFTIGDACDNATADTFSLVKTGNAISLK